MNELMSREEFLSERNAVCEPDAVAEEDTDGKERENTGGPRVVIAGAAGTEESTAETVGGITVSEIVIKDRQHGKHTGFILFLTAVAGVAAGAVLYGDITATFPDELLKSFLSGRIHGGFFGNAASSFIAALIWCIVPFLSGFCAVGQPVGIIIPAVKGIGIGTVLSALINTYGTNGIPAFAVFVLPSAFVGTIICCYQCRLSLSCSNSILAVLKGRREAAPHYYKIYLERFAVCCIGCFLLGAADAAVSFLLGQIFVI